MSSDNTDDNDRKVVFLEPKVSGDREEEPRHWRDLPSLATVDEMAEFLRVSTKTVYDMLEEGVPGSRKVGREWRISTQRFRKWFNGGEVA